MRALVSLLLTARHILTILFMFCFKLETPRCMNWTLALEHNRTILLRNVTWLFTWLKLEVGGSLETLPRINHGTILFVLRPSESAFRRVLLVAMFVRGVVAPLLKKRAAGIAKRRAVGEKPVRSASLPFKLLDQRKPFNLHPDKPKYVSGPGPWITDLWSDDPIYDRTALYAHQERMNRPAPSPDDEESAKALCLRMNALMAALNDLDGQVLRMAKLHARIAQQPRQVGKFPLRVMRPGLPPGTRQRQKHEADAVLTECHRLAVMAQRELKSPDTS